MCHRETSSLRHNLAQHLDSWAIITRKRPQPSGFVQVGLCLAIGLLSSGRTGFPEIWHHIGFGTTTEGKGTKCRLFVHGARLPMPVRDLAIMHQANVPVRVVGVQSIRIAMPASDRGARHAWRGKNMRRRLLPAVLRQPRQKQRDRADESHRADRASIGRPPDSQRDPR
jgi:hypothetical protein